MQMNVLRTKQVSHVGNRDDHGQPIRGGDCQRCQRPVGIISKCFNFNSIFVQYWLSTVHYICGELFRCVTSLRVVVMS